MYPWERRIINLGFFLVNLDMRIIYMVFAISNNAPSCGDVWSGLSDMLYTWRDFQRFYVLLYLLLHEGGWRYWLRTQRLVTGCCQIPCFCADTKRRMLEYADLSVRRDTGAHYSTHRFYLLQTRCRKGKYETSR